MDKIIESFEPKGTLTIPSSKSYAHRYLLASFIANKQLKMNNVYFSNDVNATLKALTVMGGKYEVTSSSITFLGRELKNPDEEIELDMGESASTLRLLIPVCLLYYRRIMFVGARKLFRRPLGVYFDIFNKQKIFYKLGDGYLRLRGELKPSEFEVDGTVSSQFISGLLFYNAATESKLPLKIFTNLESKNYVLMTLKTLKDYGYDFAKENNVFTLVNKDETNVSNITIEGDYTALANFAVLGSFKGNINVEGIEEDSLQADKAIIDILKELGANITYSNGTYNFQSSSLKALNDFDISDCIDLGPILFVLCASIKGKSSLIGFERLTFKESNRLESMISELSQTGVEFEQDIDRVTITSKGEFEDKNYVFDSHNDHRIAMAMTIFSLINLKHAEILGAEAVNKSYPDFFNDIEKLK